MFMSITKFIIVFQSLWKMSRMYAFSLHRVWRQLFGALFFCAMHSANVRYLQN